MYLIKIFLALVFTAILRSALSKLQITMHEVEKTAVTTYKVLKRKLRFFDCC